MLDLERHIRAPPTAGAHCLRLRPVLCPLQTLFLKCPSCSDHTDPVPPLSPALFTRGSPTSPAQHFAPPSAAARPLISAMKAPAFALLAAAVASPVPGCPKATKRAGETYDEVVARQLLERECPTAPGI